VATEEPLELDEEETPQGPVRSVYRERRYAGERRVGKVQQWFLPLPNRPKVAPLDKAMLQQKAAEVDLECAPQLLEEAKTVWQARQDRIHSAETKATTLLGTVAIAASLVVAGSGLILDPAKVADAWREILIGLLALLLTCLLLCGAMASRALLKVHKVRRPQVSQALQRAKERDPKQAQLRLALDLMDRAGDNLYVADFKLAQVRIAYRWYRFSLLFFLLFGLTIVAYVVSGDLPAR
jgi:hypothetical protein